MSETPLDHLIKTNWTRQEIAEIYNTPILELIYKGASVHRKFHETSEVQVCTLLSVKTGGCPEDCSYCPQAARYHTDVEASRLLKNEEIVGKAKEAKESGSTRFCMGAAWREVRNGREFDRVVDAVKEINGMGLEVCCTLGMLTEEQAQKLKAAGLYAYNHNLDTSEEYYDKIISTRDYSNRLDTLENVRKVWYFGLFGWNYWNGRSRRRPYRNASYIGDTSRTSRICSCKCACTCGGNAIRRTRKSFGLGNGQNDSDGTNYYA